MLATSCSQCGFQLSPFQCTTDKWEYTKRKAAVEIQPSKLWSQIIHCMFDILSWELKHFCCRINLNTHQIICKKRMHDLLLVQWVLDSTASVCKCGLCCWFRVFTQAIEFCYIAEWKWLMGRWGEVKSFWTQEIAWSWLPLSGVPGQVSCTSVIVLKK